MTVVMNQLHEEAVKLCEDNAKVIEDSLVNGEKINTITLRQMALDMRRVACFLIALDIEDEPKNGE